MARDRFIWWIFKKPSKDEIEKLLLFYLNNYENKEWIVEWDYALERWFCTLKPESGRVKADLPEGWLDPADWFEVCLSEDCLDIITRQASKHVNDVADRFARICQKKFKGTLDI